jgi:hypothetical protein
MGLLPKILLIMKKKKEKKDELFRIKTWNEWIQEAMEKKQKEKK